MIGPLLLALLAPVSATATAELHQAALPSDPLDPREVARRDNSRRVPAARSSPRSEPVPREPVVPVALARRCRVCGAAVGHACDPERLGERARRQGRTVHRGR
jgi:hypothetical protein